MFPTLLIVIMVVMVIILGLRTQTYFQCWEAPSRLLFLWSPEGGAPVGRRPQGSAVVVWCWRGQAGRECSCVPGPCCRLGGCCGTQSVAHKASSPGGTSPCPLIVSGPTEQTPVLSVSESLWVSLTGSWVLALPLICCDPGLVTSPLGACLLSCKVGSL